MLLLMRRTLARSCFRRVSDAVSDAVRVVFGRWRGGRFRRGPRRVRTLTRIKMIAARTNTTDATPPIPWLTPIPQPLGTLPLSGIAGPDSFLLTSTT